MGQLSIWHWLIVVLIFAPLAVVSNALLKKTDLNSILRILGSLVISAVLTAIALKFLFSD